MPYEILLTFFILVLSGLLAAWLPGFLLGRNPERKNSRLIAALVVFIVCLMVGRSLLSPNPQRQAEKVLTKAQFFHTLKEKEPDAYQSLLSHLVYSAQNGASDDDLLLDAQAKILPTFQKYLINASEPQLRAFLKQQTEILAQIRSQAGGNECYYSLFPKANYVLRSSRYVEKAQSATLFNTMNDILRNNIHETAPLSASFAEPALLGALEKLQPQYGKDLLLLDYPTVVGNDEERQKICDMSLSLTEMLLADSSQQASMALRLKASPH